LIGTQFALIERISQANNVLAAQVIVLLAIKVPIYAEVVHKTVSLVFNLVLSVRV